MSRKRLQSLVDELVKNRIGYIQEEARHYKICTWCGNPVTAFRDKLSEKEYDISGFCQKCQDDTFGKD